MSGELPELSIDQLLLGLGVVDLNTLGADIIVETSSSRGHGYLRGAPNKFYEQRVQVDE
eukprot:COSAG06_NODE_12264_length_1402_cov_1.653108_2_plen_59_part_00